MNKLILSVSALVCAASFHGAASAADVGVSVNISQPGFYGRIDVGRVPQPTVIYAQPMIIEQRPAMVMREPIYLRVPPGHEKRWDKYCRNYGACGQPVFFVQDRWYRDVYAPRYYGERGRPGDGRDPRWDERRDPRHGGRHDNGHHGRKDDRRDNY